VNWTCLLKWSVPLNYNLSTLKGLVGVMVFGWGKNFSFTYPHMPWLPEFSLPTRLHALTTWIYFTYPHMPWLPEFTLPTCLNYLFYPQSSSYIPIQWRRFSISILIATKLLNRFFSPCKLVNLFFENSLLEIKTSIDKSSSLLYVNLWYFKIR